MRKRTRTIGSKPLFLLLLLSLAALPLLSQNERKKDSDRKREQALAFALVAGTVFRPPGFALPGAEVTVTPAEPRSGATKFKKEKVRTDARGEFAIRVPPVPMSYSVGVQMKGFQSTEKSVSIAGEERTNLTFQLEPEDKTEEKNRGDSI
ncbi:MAG: carboxypeptidase-like regulatory domain-containing protein [Bryobacteraceae bacterium]